MGYGLYRPAPYRKRSRRVSASILGTAEHNLVLKHTNRIQAAAIRIGDVIYCSMYVSPESTPNHMLLVLDNVKNACYGRVVVMGDLNSMNVCWDRVNNSRGRALARWESLYGWEISAPKEKTFKNHQGSSTVDIFVSRGCNR